MKGAKAKNNEHPERPLIVVPAFRRPVALQRLLDSLNRAWYPDGGVRLIISLDGGADAGSCEVADAFPFRGGECEVRRHKENLGLRNHIIWCGDLTRTAASVIVLEEDLMVARDFYRYAWNALRHYQNNEYIAGIALYGPEYNEFARLPFVPLQDGHDAYFMKTACSSGQAWSAEHWSAFRSWMETAEPEALAARPGLPASLRQWPDSSWKKNFAGWMEETGRYMVYPCRSRTTNCSDPGGSHVAGRYPSDVQVALPPDVKPLPPDVQSRSSDVPSRRSDVEEVLPSDRPDNDDSRLPARDADLQESGDYRFPPAKPHPAEAEICYDTYMEPCGRYIKRLTGLAGERVDETHLETDFYGQKPEALLKRADWCLTIRPSRAPKQYYPMHFRPLENNIAHPCKPADSMPDRTRPAGKATVHTPKPGDGAIVHARKPADGAIVLTRPADIRRYRISGLTRYRLTRYFMRGSPLRADFLTGYFVDGGQKLFSTARNAAAAVFGKLLSGTK